MRRPLLAKVAPLAIFVAALIANRRAATSLLVWSDTFNDQSIINQCLADNVCTLVGVQNSIRGVFSAVAWLQFRTLVEWLGVGPSGLLVLIQVLNALAVTIVFQVARRVEGLLAGAIAASILIFGIGNLSVPINGVNNLSCLLFLGAVMTLACSAVARAPGVMTVVLAALVAAVMANVHVVCLGTGVSVVWVALHARRNRFILAVLGAVVFAVATIAGAPPSWQNNLLTVLHGELGAQATSTLTWPRTEVVSWALFGSVAWVGSLVGRTPAWVAYRRASIGAVAVVIPMLAAFLAAPLLGIYTDPKYLTAIRAACATAAALPIACVLRIVTTRVFAGPAYATLDAFAPFAAALAIAFGASLGIAHPERATTIADLTAVAHQIRDEQGWDARQIARAFTTPDRVPTLIGLLQADARLGTSRAPADGASSTAALITLTPEDLPNPLPPGWHVIRQADGTAMVLVFERTLLDWRRFDFCVPGPGGADARCEPVDWETYDPLGSREASALPHMPPPGVRWRGAFRLRVALLPDGGGIRRAIFMPRGRACGGRIVSITGTAAEISTDGRAASFVAPAPGQEPAVVELEWNVGSPECDEWHYDGLPPFLIEGEGPEVERLESMLRQREAAGVEGSPL